MATCCNAATLWHWPCEVHSALPRHVYPNSFVMGSLQDRLQAVFGSLGRDSETAAAWKPAQQQVFRSGAIDDAGNSSDEEYEERRRRETMPGAFLLLKLLAAASQA